MPDERPAAAAAEEAAVERAPALRACLFVLGGEPVAVDVRQAREVVSLGACTRVPGAPAFVRGVMNLRGAILPVVDARPRLGLPAPAAAGVPRAAILADGDVQAAVVVERVVGLDWFDEPQPLADGARGRFGGLAAGCLGRGDETFTLLDAPRLLAALRTWTGDDVTKDAP